MHGFINKLDKDSSQRPKTAEFFPTGRQNKTGAKLLVIPKNLLKLSGRIDGKRGNKRRMMQVAKAQYATENKCFVQIERPILTDICFLL